MSPSPAFLVESLKFPKKAMTHDELEFLLPAPVPEDQAMELAQEQYGLCPDVVDQGAEDATVGALADTLRQSTVWYFWWD